jgi:hypothetical protein
MLGVYSQSTVLWLAGFEGYRLCGINSGVMRIGSSISCACLESKFPVHHNEVVQALCCVCTGLL